MIPLDRSAWRSACQKVEKLEEKHSRTKKNHESIRESNGRRERIENLKKIKGRRLESKKTVGKSESETKKTEET